MSVFELEKKLYRLRRPERDGFNLQGYLGTPRTVLNVVSAEKRRLVRAWLKNNSQKSTAELKETIKALLQSNYFDVRTLPGLIIQYHKTFHQKIIVANLNRWLSCLAGWAEIDSLCQGSLGMEVFLRDWEKWRMALEKFAKDKNISKRRASLVLLTKPVRESADPRLSKLAFQNILALKTESHVLITKAISWLLRSLVVNHKKEVLAFIQQYRRELPAIAVRETIQKIKTGKKNKKPGFTD